MSSAETLSVSPGGDSPDGSSSADVDGSSADVDSSTASQEGSEDGIRNGVSSEDSKGDPTKGEDGSQAKDAAKKKRASKYTKLKQSKLDARREQFLAQVAAKSGKHPATGHSAQQQQQQQQQEGKEVAETMQCQKATEPRAANSRTSSPNDCSGGWEQLAEAFDAGVVVGERETGVAGGDPAWAFSSGIPVVGDSSNGCSLPPKSSQGSFSAGKEVLADGPQGKAAKKKGKTGPGVCVAPSADSLRDGKAGQRGVEGRNGVHKVALKTGLEKQSEVHPNDQLGEKMLEKAESAESGDPLEDDWEAAVETFSKKVAKKKGGSHRSLSLNNVEPEGQNSLAAAAAAVASASSGVPGCQPPAAVGARSLKPAAVEYSFRPNQQDAPGARSGSDVPFGQRLCPPTGLRPAYSYTASSFSRPRSAASERAWRPDDTARPQTLPPATSQAVPGQGLLGVPADLGLPVSWRVVTSLAQAQWPPPNSSQPPCCPICAEELDITDSSFVPCSCGFRLCLFCHHRIAADDGRCPGCRRAYSPDVTNRSAKPSAAILRL